MTRVWEDGWVTGVGGWLCNGCDTSWKECQLHIRNLHRCCCFLLCCCLLGLGRCSRVWVSDDRFPDTRLHLDCNLLVDLEVAFPAFVPFELGNRLQVLFTVVLRRSIALVPDQNRFHNPLNLHVTCNNQTNFDFAPFEYSYVLSH